MRRHDASIHYSAPDTAPVVLVVIDMFSSFDDPQTAPFFKAAKRIAGKIARLRQRANGNDIPTLFANDNYGRWKSDGRQMLQWAARSERGKQIVDLLTPGNEDYVILKPKHSIFFSTPIETLLRYLGTHTLILTGLSSTRCVLFSGIEAYMRDFRVYAPMDCLVSEDVREHRMAKFLFDTRLNADTRHSSRLQLGRMKRAASAD